jgi:hypothetical protein
MRRLLKSEVRLRSTGGSHQVPSGLIKKNKMENKVMLVYERPFNCATFSASINKWLNVSHDQVSPLSVTTQPIPQQYKCGSEMLLNDRGPDDI